MGKKPRNGIMGNRKVGEGIRIKYPLVFYSTFNDFRVYCLATKSLLRKGRSMEHGVTHYVPSLI